MLHYHYRLDVVLIWLFEQIDMVCANAAEGYTEKYEPFDDWCEWKRKSIAEKPNFNTY